MLGPRQSGHIKLWAGAVSHHQSLRELFFSLLFIFFFFVSSLSLLLLLPFTAAHERLFLELTWLFKDVKFTLCHGFWGRKLLVCFLPPNLLFISFSVSSCCLSKALSLSPTHFLFLIYPCVSPSPLQSDLPPHTYTLLLIPPSLFCLCSTFSYWEKKGTNLSVCSVINCDVLLLCVWKKLSKWHLTVWATIFTFYSNSCKRGWMVKKNPNNSQVSFEIPLKKTRIWIPIHM